MLETDIRLYTEYMIPLWINEYGQHEYEEKQEELEDDDIQTQNQRQIKFDGLQ